MKILATLHPVDSHDCRDVEFEIHHGGHVAEAHTYSAGRLYLRSGDAEAILRTLGGHSFGYQGELEVRSA